MGDMEAAAHAAEPRSSFGVLATDGWPGPLHASAILRGVRGGRAHDGARRGLVKLYEAGLLLHDSSGRVIDFVRWTDVGALQAASEVAVDGHTFAADARYRGLLELEVLVAEPPSVAPLCHTYAFGCDWDGVLASRAAELLWRRAHGILPLRDCAALCCFRLPQALRALAALPLSLPVTVTAAPEAVTGRSAERSAVITLGEDWLFSIALRPPEFGSPGGALAVELDFDDVTLLRLWPDGRLALRDPALTPFTFQVAESHIDDARTLETLWLAAAAAAVPRARAMAAVTATGEVVPARGAAASVEDGELPQVLPRGEALCIELLEPPPRPLDSGAAKALLEQYCAVDRNLDGVLSRREFLLALGPALGCDSTLPGALYALFDPQRHDGVRFVDFLHGAHTLLRGGPRQRMRYLFGFFDTTRRGLINKYQFATGLAALSSALALGLPPPRVAGGAAGMRGRGAPGRPASAGGVGRSGSARGGSAVPGARSASAASQGSRGAAGRPKGATSRSASRADSASAPTPGPEGASATAAPSERSAKELIDQQAAACEQVEAAVGNKDWPAADKAEQERSASPAGASTSALDLSTVGLRGASQGSSATAPQTPPQRVMLALRRLGRDLFVALPPERAGFVDAADFESTLAGDTELLCAFADMEPQRSGPDRIVSFGHPRWREITFIMHGIELAVRRLPSLVKGTPAEVLVAPPSAPALPGGSAGAAASPVRADTALMPPGHAAAAAAVAAAKGLQLPPEAYTEKLVHRVVEFNQPASRQRASTTVSKPSHGGAAKVVQGFARTLSARLGVADDRQESVDHIGDGDGSPHTAVTFNDYAPRAFAAIRRHCGINDAEYLGAVGIEQLKRALVLGRLSSLFEMSSSGRSGSFFYSSYCGRFVIKSLPAAEATTLRTLLERYHGHLAHYPDSLLTRFTGLHALICGGQKVYLVAMANVFRNTVPLHATYDLKGSSVNRSTPAEKRGPGVALKDNDFDSRRLHVDEGSRSALLEQLAADSLFLSTHNLNDYSLLLGVHEVPPERDALAAQPGPPPSAATTRFQRFYGGVPSASRREVYFFGVLDILTDYGLRKRGEHLGKSVLYDGDKVSCIAPRDYHQRFVKYVEGIVVCTATAAEGDSSASPCAGVAASPLQTLDGDAASALARSGVVSPVSDMMPIEPPAPLGASVLPPVPPAALEALSRPGPDQSGAMVLRGEASGAEIPGSLSQILATPTDPRSTGSPGPVESGAGLSLLSPSGGASHDPLLFSSSQVARPLSPDDDL